MAPVRLVSLNDNALDTWSHNMAWVLGYFAADGNVCYEDPKSGRSPGSPKITFPSVDRELIEAVKQFFGSGHKLCVKPAKDNLQTVYSIRFRSRKLSERFIELGCPPRKSTVGMNIKVPAPFRADFVRGYHDGDGFVSIGDKSREIGWLSSKENVLLLIRSYIEDAVVVPRRELAKTSWGGYQLQYGAVPDIKKVGAWMYQRRPWCERKHQRFLKIQAMNLRVSPHN